MSRPESATLSSWASRPASWQRSLSGPPSSPSRPARRPVAPACRKCSLFTFASLVVFVADHRSAALIGGVDPAALFSGSSSASSAELETFGLLGLFLGPAVLAVALAKAISARTAQPAHGD